MALSHPGGSMPDVSDHFFPAEVDSTHGPGLKILASSVVVVSSVLLAVNFAADILWIKAQDIGSLFCHTPMESP